MGNDQSTQGRDSRHRRSGSGASVRSKPWMCDGSGATMATKGAPKADDDEGVAAARLGNDVVRVPKAAEIVAARLRRQIITGELKFGEHLGPENELLTRYGLSRPTLREAFRILETESLITIVRGANGGVVVNRPRVELALGEVGQSTASVLAHTSKTGKDAEDAFNRLANDPRAPHRVAAISI